MLMRTNTLYIFPKVCKGVGYWSIQHIVIAKLGQTCKLLDKFLFRFIWPLQFYTTFKVWSLFYVNIILNETFTIVKMAKLEKKIKL